MCSREQRSPDDFPGSDASQEPWRRQGADHFLSLTLHTLSRSASRMPPGPAIGVALIALIGWWLYGQPVDPPAMLGLALIISGVLVLNVFSKSIAH
jgi:small multidrug resistance pump